ncbi:hypothetical protein [Streptomyces sp. NPDC001880]
MVSSGRGRPVCWARFAQLLELSTTVSTHPFWDSVEADDRVAARMVLKHAHEPAEDEA